MRSLSRPAQTKQSAASVNGRPLRLQRKCTSCGVASKAQECQSCERKRLQRRPVIGREDSALEVEADRAAAAVLVGSGSPAQPPHITPASRVPAEAFGPIPDSIERVLAQPGGSLDHGTRSFMERRFGADFAAVRVHHEGGAAQSARDVGARAYTVGSHIVFGAGQYAPGARGGRELIAHELAHTLQQDASPRQLQRTCLPAAECATKQATLTEFVKETESKPQNVSKKDKRKAACQKVPPDPSCTSDGHGAKATALTDIMTTNYASRFGFITGIFVDKDMPAEWGAYTSDCSSFMPPLAGGKCSFVPDVLEAQAKLYQRGAQSVGGRPRAGWLTSALDTLTHETEHARFDTATPIAEPNATACKFADHESNLSEMAARLSEMHVYYRAALAKPEKDRFNAFYAKFAFWVGSGGEDINGIIKDMRCKCECADVDYYITKTSESVSSAQKWDSNELRMIHTELRDPKWALKWPVAPPASVNAADLPSTAAVPLKLE